MKGVKHEEEEEEEKGCLGPERTAQSQAGAQTRARRER